MPGTQKKIDGPFLNVFPIGHQKKLTSCDRFLMANYRMSRLDGSPQKEQHSLKGFKILCGFSKSRIRNQNSPVTVTSSGFVLETPNNLRETGVQREPTAGRKCIT